MKEKNQLRLDIAQKLKILTESAKLKESQAIIQKINSLPIWQEAKVISLYSPTSDEVNLLPLLMNDDKAFCFPRYREINKAYELALVDDFSSQVSSGKYGILEPQTTCSSIDRKKIDLWLVPALAYDLQGYRLGHGYGYYDKLLYQSSGYRIGICFQCQLVDKLPFQIHDEKVNKVIK